MRHNMKKKNKEDYFKDMRFLEFLDWEFMKTSYHATYEELADFAFGGGGIDEAIRVFEELEEQRNEAI